MAVSKLKRQKRDVASHMRSERHMQYVRQRVAAVAACCVLRRSVLRRFSFVVLRRIRVGRTASGSKALLQLQSL